MEKGLTPKQRLFVNEYLIDMNATDAYIRAGYAVKNRKVAQAMSCRLLSKDIIADAVRVASESRLKRVVLNADMVLHELLLIARADIGAAFDADGKLLPIKEIPEDTRRAMSGIDTETRRDVTDETAGEADEITVRKVRFWDKPKALEQLGRHLKLYTDRMEHDVSDNLAERLARARARIAPGEQNT